MGQKKSIIGQALVFSKKQTKQLISPKVDIKVAISLGLSVMPKAKKSWQKSQGSSATKTRRPQKPKKDGCTIQPASWYTGTSSSNPGPRPSPSPSTPAPLIPHTPRVQEPVPYAHLGAGGSGFPTISPRLSREIG